MWRMGPMGLMGLMSSLTNCGCKPLRTKSRRQAGRECQELGVSAGGA